ncbi:MAG TPA: response regulator transcription factor [Solirubrobacteraceae bacterium]|jgi:DNA-binding NarL/FixJ family response regulator
MTRSVSNSVDKPESSAVTIVVGRFDDLLARGIQALIEDDARLELLAGDVPIQQLATVLRARSPRVAIVDASALRSPAEVRELTTRHPATHLLVLAHEPSSLECSQLLAFGAAACLSKATQTRDVLNAIHLASRGMQLIPRAGFGAPEGSGLLTPREADVLARLHQRRSNAQIAADLHISVETVRTHTKHIYRKLGVASRRELIAPLPLDAASQSA